MTPFYQVLERIALDAGAAILAVYDGSAKVCCKDDHSPVTDADMRAEAIILDGLMSAFPKIPVVAEESVASGRVPDISDGTFFLVDPLDGTKEFINRRDDFTVNIALIVGNAPVAGIVYAPALHCAYVADEHRAQKLLLSRDHCVEHRQTIRARRRGSALTAVASRSHNSSETDAFLASHGVVHRISIGSSLKFCLLAEGKADIYPRLGRTMEWDTAAGDAVLAAAGGMVVQWDGSRLPYGKTEQTADSDFANPQFIAWADVPA